MDRLNAPAKSTKLLQALEAGSMSKSEWLKLAESAYPIRRSRISRLSQMRTAGLIREAGDRVCLTPQARMLLGTVFQSSASGR